MTALDPELVEFAKRVGIVLGATLAVITVAGKLWRAGAKYGPVSLRTDIDRLERIVARLAMIVELQAIIQSSPVHSKDRAEALEQLHRLRRVTALDEDRAGAGDADDG